MNERNELTMAQLKQYADFKLLMDEAKAMQAEMKDTVDASFAERYVHDGTKTRDVLEGGEKVAALTWVPPTPAKEFDVLVVEDDDALAEWAEENLPAALGVVMDVVQGHFDATGELPDGCAVTKQYKAGRGGYVKVTPTKPYKAAFSAQARKLLEGGA